MTDLPNLDAQLIGDGKLIGMVLANGSENQVGMIVLERARVEVVSGRTFVTGSIPKDNVDSWVRGLPASVAWEHVGYYLVFDSYDEYKARMKQGSRPWWRRLLDRISG